MATFRGSGRAASRGRARTYRSRRTSASGTGGRGAPVSSSRTRRVCATAAAGGVPPASSRWIVASTSRVETKSGTVSTCPCVATPTRRVGAAGGVRGGPGRDRPLPHQASRAVVRIGGGDHEPHVRARPGPLRGRAEGAPVGDLVDVGLAGRRGREGHERALGVEELVEQQAAGRSTPPRAWGARARPAPTPSRGR